MLYKFIILYLPIPHFDSQAYIRNAVIFYVSFTFSNVELSKRFRSVIWERKGTDVSILVESTVLLITLLCNVKNCLNV